MTLLTGGAHELEEVGQSWRRGQSSPFATVCTQASHLTFLASVFLVFKNGEVTPAVQGCLGEYAEQDVWSACTQQALTGC